MNWKETQLNFGIVPEGSTVKVVFQGTDHLPPIAKINAGCGSCTTYSFDEETKQLHVSIKLGSIPVHLRMHDKDQQVVKTLTVFYHNGDGDVLSVTGYKKKK